LEGKSQNWQEALDLAGKGQICRNKTNLLSDCFYGS